jgi:uncharacterized membrane protein
MMASYFTLFKFIHVTAAILWIGGASTLGVLNARLAREEDRAALATLLRQANFLGRAILGPAAALTLIAGIATAVSVGFDFGALWITWGFIGVFGSMLLGATFIRRANVRLGELVSTVEPENSRLSALQRRIALLNLINVLLLLSTVGAMVFKPVL